MFGLLSTFNLQFSTFGQGSLTPPGPPAPTMKTLAQIEPRAPISSLPVNITKGGSYYVTTNLSGISGQYGITISSGNVAIDLNGFTLSGVTGSISGILVISSYTNITVRNGTLTGWGGDGLNGAGGSARNMVFEKLTVSANGGRGIVTEAGSIVRDCLSTSNHFDGILSYGGQIIRCLGQCLSQRRRPDWQCGYQRQSVGEHFALRPGDHEISALKEL